MYNCISKRALDICHIFLNIGFISARFMSMGNSDVLTHWLNTSQYGLAIQGRTISGSFLGYMKQTQTWNYASLNVCNAR